MPLVLPKLILIADGFTQPALTEQVIEVVVAGGIEWIHLRDHQANAVTFREAGSQLVALLRKHIPLIRISINTDIELAKKLGVGVHIGHRGPALAEARTLLRPDTLLGYSAHHLNELSLLKQHPPDYVFLSPIFPTQSKPDHAGIGLDALHRFCQQCPVPVYALGGITPSQVPACLETGAYGVAVLSGILHVERPAIATQSYRNALFDIGRLRQKWL